MHWDRSNRPERRGAWPLAAVLALAAGCPGPDTGDWPDPNPDTDTDTDTEPGTDTDTDTEPDSDLDTSIPETTHCGTLAGAHTWAAADNPHVVTCHVDLEGAALTIEAGTQVYFLPGTSLRVSRSGFQSDLRVLGTAEAPVWMGPASGPGTGKWTGVRVNEFAGAVELRHLTIDGGGSGGDETGAGTLWVDEVAISAEQLTVSGSGGVGINLRRRARFAPGSSGVRAEGNASYAVAVHASQAHTVPAAGSAYTGNGIDAVRVDRGTITTSVSWADLAVPYAVVGLVDLEGIAEAPAILTIDPGTELRFDVGAGLRASPGGGASGIVAEGTPAAPILFTSLRAAVPRHWVGVEAWPATVNDKLVLRHVTIEWAGSSTIHRANLLVEGTPLLADHLTVRHGLAGGIRMHEHSGLFREGSGAIVSTENALPLQIAASAAWTVPDDPDSTYVGNDIDRIAVTGNQVYYSQTWPLPDAPWWVSGNLDIAGPDGGSATLTLLPGTEIAFDFGSRMRVGSSFSQGLGAVSAVGTPEAPIVFTAGNAFTWGAWGGIALGACPPGSTRFENFEVAYADVAFNLTATSLLDGRSCHDVVITEGWIHHMAEAVFRGAPDDWEPGDGLILEDNLGDSEDAP